MSTADFAGIRVVEAPALFARSTGFRFAPNGRTVFVHSTSALVLAVIGGVHWHDEPEHCPTWAVACRCDVEGGGR